ncbi:MAG: ABC transporter permease [Phycisphaerae bacterium]|jgi:simple sugar transport system permease protein
MAELSTPAPARRINRLVWPAAALLLLLLFNLVCTRGFFSLEIKDGHLYGSLIDVLNQAAPVLLTSLGMTLVIATGGVDLSVGAVMAMAGAVAAVLITQTTASVGLIIAGALGVSLAAGLWNGLLVALFRVQPIVATLVLMVAGRGLAQLLTKGQVVGCEHPTFCFIGGGYLFALPFTVTLFAVMFGAAALLTRGTALGLLIEAVGNNEAASRCAGVRVRLVKLLAYGFCGLCAGLAGIVDAADIRAADVNHLGEYLELDAILAVVIGGTALTGGRFSLIGTVIGALIIQTLTTTILTHDVPVEHTLVVKALVVLVVCLLQAERLRELLRRWRATA